MKPDLTFDIPFSLDFEPTIGRPSPGTEMHLTGETLRTTHKRRRRYDLSRVPNAVRLIKPLPKTSETIHALMGGDFHAWDLIPAIQGQLKGPIAELYITTLGFNSANNQHLCDMIDAGDVKRAWVLCSEYFRDADRDVFNAAEKRLTERGARIKAVRNHSKIIALCPENSLHCYTVESSANLRSCNNIEQFTLTNDRELFAFHRKWIRAQFA